MSPAHELGRPITSQRATPRASAASSVGAQSARRPRGGHRTPVIGSGVAPGSRSAVFGVPGAAGRKTPAR
jgi:hypothetical protein